MHGFRGILAAVLSCSSKAAVKVLILSSVILYQVQEPYLQTRRACLLTHADIGVICSTVCKHLGSDDQRRSENEVTLFFIKLKLLDAFVKSDLCHLFLSYESHQTSLPNLLSRVVETCNAVIYYRISRLVENTTIPFLFTHQLHMLVVVPVISQQSCLPPCRKLM